MILKSGTSLMKMKMSGTRSKMREVRDFFVDFFQNFMILKWF